MLRKLLCFFGKHVYETKNLKCYYDSNRKLYIFDDKCIICGKEFHDEVPAKDIESSVRRKNG